MHTLYKRLGGAEALEAVVEQFYRMVMADTRIKHLFKNSDIEKLKAHQERFLTYATGGAAYYSGRTMQRAHHRLVQDHGLNDGHFDAVIDNLRGALRSLDVPTDLIEEVCELANSVRDDVLGRRTPNLAQTA